MKMNTKLSGKYYLFHILGAAIFVGSLTSSILVIKNSANNKETTNESHISTMTSDTSSISDVQDHTYYTSSYKSECTISQSIERATVEVKKYSTDSQYIPAMTFYLKNNYYYLDTYNVANYSEQSTHRTSHAEFSLDTWSKTNFLFKNATYNQTNFKLTLVATVYFNTTCHTKTLDMEGYTIRVRINNNAVKYITLDDVKSGK